MMDDAAALPVPVRRRHRVFATLLVSWCLIVAVVYLLDTEGLGGMVLTLTTAGLYLAMAAGPLIRRTRPKRLWFMVSTAGAFFASTVLQDWVEWRLGPFEYSDVVFLLGYAALLFWITLLARETSDPVSNSVARLDTAAACVGVALASWALLLAPLGTLADVVTGVVWALYPPLDIALLVLCVHLAVKLRRVPRPLQYLIAAAVILAVTDTIYAVLEVREAEAYDIPVLEVGLFAAAVLLALTFTDARIGELTPRRGGVEENRFRRSSAAIVFVVLPVVASAATPEVGVVDYVVRTVLVAVLLALIFARLSVTIAALSAAHAESRHRATHDPLTGLVNRSALVDAIGSRLREDAAAGRHTILMFLDCDDFKFVNDTWGHPAGDTLLIDVATRLRAAVRADDVVARHGGDEFVILASGRGPGDGVALADRVRTLFDAPLRISETRTHPMTPSLGVSVVAPDDGCTAEDLIGRADAAMYVGKQQGRGRWVLFDDAMSHEVRLRQVVGETLAAGLDLDHVDVRLHPVMGGDHYDGVHGWEAVARWQDPVLGEVDPEMFRPVADELGLTGPLEEHLVLTACRRLASLHAAGADPDSWISIGVSLARVLDPDFVPMTRAALAETRLDPRLLHVEIEESPRIADSAAAVAALRALRETGVRVYVCDFGTGKTSLQTVLRTPFDGVKLSPQLVDRLGKDEVARRHVAVVLALLTDLGVGDVIAEAVDEPDQASVLAELRCPHVQGALYPPGGGQDLAVAEGTSPSDNSRAEVADPV